MNDELKQLKIFVTQEHYEMLQAYGIKHNILATTGRHVGQPHLSAIVRLAIEQLIKANGQSDA